MEKIKVNMSPNPLDVQTIHASQNDGEARQWEFELHNNGDVIDSSEVTDQITFKAYKGGTEEILPSALYNGSVDLGSLTWDYISEIPIYQATITDGRFVRGQDLPCDMYSNSGVMSSTNMPNMTYQVLDNGTLWIKNTSYSSADSFKTAMQGVYLWYQKTDSTPSTSQFDGTIKYPSGSVDSYFTYRQSPTEKDGLAKITDIKGNTLGWNQLVQNGNFASTDGWNSNGTLTVQNNVATIVFETPTRNSSLYTGARFNLITGHKYLYSLEININDNNRCQLEMHNQSWNKNNVIPFNVVSGNNNIKIINICENGDSALALSLYFFVDSVPTETKTVKIKNVQIFDLTQMGLDSLTVEEFTSLFNLPYYDFNQGSLLSFNGNVIKTVGKNLFNSADVIIGRYVNDANGVFSVESNSVATNYIEIFPNTEYKIISAQTTIASSGMWGAWYDANKTFISGFSNYVTAKTSPSNAKYMAFTISYSGRNQDYANNVMLLFNGEDETFEPYTSSTTNLPISTYFPTGMKRVNNGVYDEFTQSKATTRIGAVDMGTMVWIYDPSYTRFYSTTIANLINKTGAFRDGLNCARYEPNASPISGQRVDKTIAKYNNGNIYVVDRSFTDATAFTQAMSGVYLYYELATPTETSFTTASLVTENAEIPLSNEDGILIGKCTEQLSENPGFIDAKIKLSDADGECYSNKIQLHVERSPQ